MITILGYGNPLRSDDGVGWVLAEQLGERLGWDALKVHLLHQLTPELIAMITESSMVVFIDARQDGSIGNVACHVIEPRNDKSVFTHNATPEALLGAVMDWHGSAPLGLLISVSGASFDYGEHLSEELQENLPTILDEIEQLVRLHAFTLKEDHHARVWDC